MSPGSIKRKRAICLNLALKRGENSFGAAILVIGYLFIPTLTQYHSLRTVLAPIVSSPLDGIACSQARRVGYARSSLTLWNAKPGALNASRTETQTGACGASKCSHTGTASSAMANATAVSQYSRAPQVRDAVTDLLRVDPEQARHMLG